MRKYPTRKALKSFPGIKEKNKQQQRIQKCAASADMYSLVLDIQNNRQIARNIRNREQDDKCA